MAKEEESADDDWSCYIHDEAELSEDGDEDFAGGDLMLCSVPSLSDKERYAKEEEESSDEDMGFGLFDSDGTATPSESDHPQRRSRSRSRDRDRSVSQTEVTFDIDVEQKRDLEISPHGEKKRKKIKRVDMLQTAELPGDSAAIMLPPLKAKIHGNVIPREKETGEPEITIPILSSLMEKSELVTENIDFQMGMIASDKRAAVETEMPKRRPGAYTRQTARMSTPTSSPLTERSELSRMDIVEQSAAVELDMPKRRPGAYTKQTARISTPESYPCIPERLDEARTAIEEERAAVGFEEAKKKNGLHMKLTAKRSTRGAVPKFFDAEPVVMSDEKTRSLVVEEDKLALGLDASWMEEEVESLASKLQPQRMKSKKLHGIALSEAPSPMRTSSDASRMDVDDDLFEVPLAPSALPQSSMDTTSEPHRRIFAPQMQAVSVRAFPAAAPKSSSPFGRFDVAASSEICSASFFSHADISVARTSQAYSPTSPAYSPTSPAYSPSSPAYFSLPPSLNSFQQQQALPLKKGGAPPPPPTAQQFAGFGVSGFMTQPVASGLFSGIGDPPSPPPTNSAYFGSPPPLPPRAPPLPPRASFGSAAPPPSRARASSGGAPPPPPPPETVSFGSALPPPPATSAIGKSMARFGGAPPPTPSSQTVRSGSAPPLPPKAGFRCVPPPPPTTNVSFGSAPPLGQATRSSPLPAFSVNLRESKLGGALKSARAPPTVGLGAEEEEPCANVPAERASVRSSLLDSIREGVTLARASESERASGHFGRGGRGGRLTMQCDRIAIKQVPLQQVTQRSSGKILGPKMRGNKSQLKMEDLDKLLASQSSFGYWEFGPQLDQILGIDSTQCIHLLKQNGLTSLGQIAAEQIKQELATILVIFSLVKLLMPELLPSDASSSTGVVNELLFDGATLFNKMKASSLRNLPEERQAKLIQAMTEAVHFCLQMDRRHPLIYSRLELGTSWLHAVSNLMQPTAAY